MSKTIECNIFLIGFMGAGKSTIARNLQRKLNFPLVEMDERIVREQGMSINDIFEKYGEDHFRDIESDLILAIGREGASIVWCGGSSTERREHEKNRKNRFFESNAGDNL